MRFFLLTSLLFVAPQAYAERLSGINLQLSPFVASGELSNKARVKNHLGFKTSLDKVFDVGSDIYIGPRLEAGNSYLTTQRREAGRKIISTYDNRFVTGGFKTGFWFGPEIHPSDVYLAAGFGRGYSKLKIDESGDHYYAQRDVNKIEGNYRAVEVGGNWHVRRGFSFNAGLFSHIYNANLGKARQSVDSEVATTEGVRLTNGEEVEDLDEEITQKSYGLAFGFTLGF